MQEILKFENVTVSYDNRQILHNISFSVNPGEILGIVGESGCGKSTLLKTVLDLSGPKVTEGKILFENRDIRTLRGEKKRELRGRAISMVFQESATHINPLKTVGATVYEAMRAHVKISKADAYATALNIFNNLSLPDPERILKSYPFELSGGMNQRVGIALAMLNKPSLLLADEPTSALDAIVAVQIVEELRLLRQKYNTAIILVTHNIKIARYLTDNILVLNGGEIADYGNTKSVLSSPKSNFTKELMASSL